MHEECSICLESIDSRESVETLCNHTFHKKCLSQVVQVNEENIGVYIRCPICREQIPPIVEPLNDPTYNFLYVSVGVLVSGFIGAVSFWLILRYASLS